MWDLDGTLINSEPYWAESEKVLLNSAGQEWNYDIAAKLQGNSLTFVAEYMISSGVTDKSVEEIAQFMVEYVYRKEVEVLPWTAGVYEFVGMLRDAGIPQMVVTSSPEKLAKNVVAQAPEGAFVGFVSDDTDVEHKPSPEPYLYAARHMGVKIEDCLIFEDSVPGLTAAGASGASWVSVTGYSSIDARELGLAKHFIENFEGLGLEDVQGFMAR